MNFKTTKETFNYYKMNREDYVKLMNIYYDFKVEVDDFNDLDDKQFDEQVVIPFLEELSEAGYDGDEEYNAIYWFLKGLKLSPPQLKRYDESEEYKQSVIKGKQRLEELNALNEYKTQFNQSFNTQNTINQGIINFNKHLLRPLAPEFKPLPRYDESEEYLKRLDDVMMKRIEIQNYDQWKEFEEEDQTNVIDEIINQLEMKPDNWTIDFKTLNAKSKLELLKRLKDFFETYIAELSESKEYRFSFEVFGHWHSKPFSPELYQKMLDNFTKLNFVYDFGEPMPDYISGGTIDELPEWSYFTSISFSKSPPKTKGNNDRGGHFFKYLVHDVPSFIKDYLVKLQIFDSLTKNGKVRSELNDCCFVYALRQSKIPKDVINKIKLAINTRYLSPRKIDILCTNNLIHCVCTYIEEGNGKNTCRKLKSTLNGKSKSYLGVSEKEAKYKITLACYEEHFFIEEKSPFSTYFIDHIDEIGEIQNYYDKRFQKDSNGGYWRKSNSFATSSQIVRSLFKQNHFRRIKYGEYGVLKTVFYDEVKDALDYNLEYEDSAVRKIVPINKGKEFMDKIKEVYYADFEADVSQDIHNPFMVCIQNRSGTKKQTFIGKDCAKDFLNFIPHNSLVYFHNLAYDIRMFAHLGITKSLIKGSKTLSAEIEYGTITFNKKVKGKIETVTKPKKIYFKDTLPVLNCKLIDLPERFGLKDIKKELFPYKYYTLERLESNIGTINEAGVKEDKVWNNKDYEEFKSNIDSIANCRIDENHFDMYKYAEFYCMQDVNVLRLSFNQFQTQFYIEFQINVYNELTISAIANKVFRKRVYESNGNLYEVSGHVQHFIQKAVRGGRCMTAFNRKWHTLIKMLDFDAVALYASAMARLYTVEGKPQVIKPEQLNMEFLSKQSAYVVDIKVTKANKHFAFPLLVKKMKTRKRSGKKTHTLIENVNDDYVTEPITITVDNIGLEDLIEFQKIEFELIRGYYWDGAKDYKIQKVIKNLFNKRLEYKKQGNSLQELYKLIMNSCYGKTIQKPVKYEHRYIKEADLNKYWYKNYYKIVECSKLNNNNRADGSETESIYDVKILKQIDNQYNFSLLGVQVLSMSKRIMNEVMCLAYDLGIRIYYQDTDSMHLEADDLPKLAEEFKKKYNRELIGKEMGQFHSDFKEINKHKETPYAIESIFIAKKIYMDKLTDSTGEIGYHLRGKGITQQSIKAVTNENFNGDYVKMYEALYNNETLTFDLAAGQPSFEMNNDFTVSSRKEFLRKVKTDLEEGKPELYFTYEHK